MWTGLAIAVAVAAVLVVGYWASWSARRLDRLHARVDAAEDTLDAELVRRGQALVRLVAAGPAAGPLPDALARRRPPLGDPDRQATENDVGRAALAALTRLPDGPDAAELRETLERVRLARLFYDDAVRDTRILRGRPLTRLFHLAGHAPLPAYFDIEDAVAPVRNAGAPLVPSTVDSEAGSH